MSRWSAVVLAPLLLSASAAGADPFDKGTQKCINEANKNLGKVALAAHKLSETCVKNQAKGKTPSALDCIIEDEKDKLGKAAVKAIENTAKKCLDGDPEILAEFFGSDIFGPEGIGFLTVTTAVSKEADLLEIFLGSDIDAAVVTGKDDAKCQQKLLKDLYKCQDIKLKEFSTCKKKGLKDGSIMSPEDLSTLCLGANGSGPGQPDPKGKIAKACDPDLGLAKPSTLGKGVIKSCIDKGVPVASVLPGRCSSAGDDAAVAACAEAQVECLVCLALDFLESTTRDCDEFDDGLANKSCGGPCSIGPPLDPAEDPSGCVEMVCGPPTFDSFCCDGFWDASCVDHALSIPACGCTPP